jgi:hypothetical protein
MDGVVADFGRAFHEVDERLFGAGPGLSPGQPENEEEKASVPDTEKPDAEKEDERSPIELRRRRDLIWKAIQTTPDFWVTLSPTEEGAVRRIHPLMLQPLGGLLHHPASQDRRE